MLYLPLLITEILVIFHTFKFNFISLTFPQIPGFHASLSAAEGIRFLLMRPTTDSHCVFLRAMVTEVTDDTTFPPQWGFPGGSGGEGSAYNVVDPGLSPGLGISSGEGNGYPPQYFGLENSMDRGAWQSKVHGVDRTERLTFSLLLSLIVTAKTSCLSAVSNLLLLGIKSLSTGNGGVTHQYFCLGKNLSK